MKAKHADEGLRAAIVAAGSARALARQLGISSSAVARWRSVPLARVFDVEATTRVPRERLRPDMFGSCAPARPRLRKPSYTEAGE